MDKQVFLDSQFGEGKKAKGGWFYRDFDLIKFIEKLEKDPRGGRVVGIRIDGNNLELMTEVSELA